MSKRVLIIGAGASKSYGSSPTGYRMPIATDFFSTYSKLEISENPHVLVGAVVNYVQRTRGVRPESFGSYEEDIEQLHSEIEDSLEEALRSHNRTESLRLLSTSTQLVFMFVSVINEIQNGPVSPVHVTLASKLTPEDTIVTFNWDTLLDRALAETTKWRPDVGYHLTPMAIYEDGWRACTGAPENVIRYPTILKLHGSTNWLTSYNVLGDNFKVAFTHDSAPDDFFVYVKSDKPYDCYDGRYMPGYTQYSYGYYPTNLPVRGKPPGEGRVVIMATPRSPFTPKGQYGSDGLVSMPLIIPPTKHKRYDFYGELFRKLWKQAEMELSEADEIHVYGYSFPRTDIQSAELMKQAFLKRDRIPRVVIVNPAPDAVAERFQLELGVPVSKIEVVREYMGDSFSFDGLL